MTLFLMLQKELRELATSYKLLFVPAAFALLGGGQPIAYKLLPTLLKNASNLPPGAVLQIPVPAPGAVVASALGQFGQLGMVLLILVAMGTIAGERQTGVAATVLTKPVARGTYLAAKIAAYGLLAAFSLALGVAVTAFYTDLLIGPVNWAGAFLGGVLYLPNLLLAVAATVAFSAFMPTPLAAGGAALVAYIVLSTVPRYLGAFARQAYPVALAERAAAAMIGKPLPDAKALGLTFPGASLPFTAVLILALGFTLLGWLLLRRQEI
ncbi:MAG: ABC transporter permease subunit [Symbiobacteriia bacterium]